MKGFFAKTGGVLATVVLIAIIVVAVLPVLHRRNYIAYGRVEDFAALERQEHLDRYLSFFPKGSQEIYYWVCPYSNDVGGEYTISKHDFFEWAATMGFTLSRIEDSRHVVSPVFIFEENGKQRFASPSSGYFYESKTCDSEGRIIRQFVVIYDASAHLAAFSLMTSR